MTVEVATTRTGIPRLVVGLMSVATGVAVASNYYIQPLLDSVAQALHTSSGSVGLVFTLAQLGYAAGLIFFLPLGDLLERRRLVVVMTLATALGLGVMGFAGRLPVLMVAAVVVGLLSVVAQILVPFAAALAPPEARGKVVGTVMSGLLLGILLARTLAGYLAEVGGWPTIYRVAAVVMLVLAALLHRYLPTSRAEVALGYPALLRSTLSLVREEPVLRLRAIYGALSFGMFSVLWNSIALLLSDAPYHYGSGVIGLFGLVGAVGVLGANLAGRVADKGGASRVTAVAVVTATLVWLPIAFGRTSLVALIAGIILLDFAAQSLHITNQSEIYRLRAAAGSRLNSAYMTARFLGGALGSGLSTVAYTQSGWTGVSVLGALFGLVITGIWGTRRLLGRD
ncbi:MAG TPA: MFS transporter [Amycolatopsis sp.]|nr:MFS transporter [Amycolatopsis sp.]